MLTKEQWLAQKAKCVELGRCILSRGYNSDACVVRKTDCVSAGLAGKVTTPITDLYECSAEECREDVKDENKSEIH